MSEAGFPNIPVVGNQTEPQHFVATEPGGETNAAAVAGQVSDLPEDLLSVPLILEMVSVQAEAHSTCAVCILAPHQTLQIFSWCGMLIQAEVDVVVAPVLSKNAQKRLLKWEK